jgi:hypothetical protein
MLAESKVTFRDLLLLLVSPEMCSILGLGKSTYLLSSTYSLLLPAAICPNDYVSSEGVMLACYQQVGSGRKYIGVSRKWVR